MKFGKKMSVSAFKAMHNAATLDIVLNPKTDRLFVVADGATVGAVSKNYNKALADKEFVEMIFEDGATLWCLHNPSKSNVVETL